MTTVVLSWSGGKDAAYALSRLQRADDVEVVELLTTVSTETDRTSMHGVRRALTERQASAVGLPLRVVELPADPSNEEYERVMAETMDEYRDREIETVAFADLLLEDVREYREDRLSRAGMEGLWPLWGRDTGELATEFVEAGFRARVVCVDGDLLDRSFAGREFDGAFLADLPDGVDPCGEHGEFHTFVFDGPIFDRAVAHTVGETVTRPVGDGEFHYCDLER